MHILSNLHLLDDEGCCMPPVFKIVWLNEAVHQLGWQACVLEGIEQRASLLAVRNARLQPSSRLSSQRSVHATLRAGDSLPSRIAGSL